MEPPDPWRARRPAPLATLSGRAALTALPDLPARAAPFDLGVLSAVFVLVAGRPPHPLVPPELKAQPPSLEDGPLPVSRTQPTSGHRRAWSNTKYSSSTVWGRKALRTSGRLKATRTVP